LAEVEAHEQLTHRELGAILGFDTSLADGAKRLKDERDTLRAANAAMTKDLDYWKERGELV